MHDGGIDHRVFVVGILGEMLEDPFPDTGLGPVSKAGVNRLPVSEALRQVPSGRAGSIWVQSRLNKQAVALGGHAHIPLTSWQKIFEPLPAVVM